MPRTRRDRARPRPHDARERLVAAAAELVAERGYSGAGLNGICKRAGVAKTSLYWHFGSKEALLVEVLQKLQTDLREEVQKAVAAAPHPGARIDALLRAWRSIVLERPNLLRFPFHVGLATGPECGPAREILAASWRASEALFIEDLAGTTGLSEADLEPIAHTAVALLQGAFLRFRLEPDVDLLDRNLEELKRTILVGVRARLSEVSHAEASRDVPPSPARRASPSSAHDPPDD